MEVHVAIEIASVQYLKVAAECKFERVRALFDVTLMEVDLCHQQMSLKRVAIMVNAALENGLR